MNKNSGKVLRVKVSLSELEKGLNRRTKSESVIGNNLIERGKKSKSKIESKRLQRFSLDFEENTFVPKIIRKKYKVSYPKNTRKIDKIYKEAELREKNRHEESIKISMVKGKIDNPDLSHIKDYFNSREVKRKSEDKENFTKMNLVQKTQFFQKKRKLGIELADKEKERLKMKDCTFKPDLIKKVADRRVVVGSLTARKHGDQGTGRDSRASSVSFSQSYFKISPDEQGVSFREGMNVEKLMIRSKPMINYSVVTRV